MFQRFRGALENLQAEEKPRYQQRLGQTRRTSSPGTITRAARGGSGSSGGSNKEQTKDVKEKDPSEFDLGDDTPTGSLSRANTPVTGSGPDERQKTSGDGKDVGDGASSMDSSNLADLPADVRVKLRRLEKLEPKFQELVKGFRAKKQLIEPFEKALREHTSCTTIADPTAFVEYLNMASLQAEMTRGEYQRVTKEYEELKKEVKELQGRHKEELGEKDSEIKKQEDKVKELEAKGTSGLLLEPLSGLPLANKTSPISSPLPRPAAAPVGEDIFSFEDEHGKLEELVRNHEEEIEKLKQQLEDAKLAQKAAEETMQNNLESVENAQRELEGLRDVGSVKDKEISGLLSKNEALVHEVEEQKKNTRETGELIAKRKKETEALETQVKLLKEKVQTLEVAVTAAQNSEHTVEENTNDNEIKELKSERTRLLESVKTLERQLGKARNATDSATRELFEIKSSLEKRVRELEDKLTGSLETIAQLQTKTATEAAQLTTTQPVIDLSPATTRPQTPASSTGTHPSKSTKKRKKKKGKGGAGTPGVHNEPEEGGHKEEVLIKTTENVEDESNVSPFGPDPLAQVVRELKSQLSILREQLDERDEQFTKLRERLSQIEELQEEIETLRESLSDVGQANVEGKDQIKGLEGKTKMLISELETTKAALGEKGDQLLSSLDELAILQASHESTSTEHQKLLLAHSTLQEECGNLKQKISTLQSELLAAEKLSETRFKNFKDVKDILARKEPELSQLKIENANLTTQNNEANLKLVEMKKLERVEQDLRREVASLKSKVSDNQIEIDRLKNQVKLETSKRTKAEEAAKNLQNDLRKAEDEQKDAIDVVERTSRELSRAQEEVTNLRQRTQNLERELNKIKSEKEGLAEDLQLKIAVVASAQSSMSTMRDQASELATQMKETKARCESLEEDLAEANRLLQERSREADTMRRLLNEAESRSEARIRDMKQKMETAFEERDKAEEEVATIGRSRAKEIEELRNRVREAERLLKKVEEAKEITEKERKEYQSGKQKAESALESLTQELDDTKKANEQMRDTLDETERQMKAVEQRGMQTRKEAEDLRAKYEKLTKSHKVNILHFQGDLHILIIFRHFKMNYAISLFVAATCHPEHPLIPSAQTSESPPLLALLMATILAMLA